MIGKIGPLPQTKQMYLRNQEGGIPGRHSGKWHSHYGPCQSRRSSRMERTQERQGYLQILGLLQLLQVIHQRIFTNSEAIEQPPKERCKMGLGQMSANCF